MSAAARVAFLLALIVWLGEVLFLSLVVAPILFQTFPVEEAGRVVSALFPIYYKVGATCGIVLLVATLTLRGIGADRRLWTVTAGVVGIMLVATLYAAAIVQPRAQELRPQLHQTDVPPAVKAEFDVLHRRAVQLNSVVLIGGLAVAAGAAVKLRP